MEDKKYTNSLFSFIDFSFIVKDERIYSSDPYVIFVRKLHESFTQNCLASRVSLETGEDADYEWPKDLGFLKLTHKSTFQLFSKNLYKLKESTLDLFSKASEYETLLLCWPHPISYLIAKKFKGKKKVFFLVRQNQSEITKAKYQGVKKSFALMGLRFLDRKLDQLKEDVQIITVGEEMNRHFQKRGFDSEIIVDSLIPKSYKSRVRSISGMVPQLLYVGRLEREKGVDILIDACDYLSQKGFGFQLKIIGTGSEKAALMSQIERLGLNGQITFEGHVKHGELLYSFFESSDVLVIPSRTEGFPKTIHEARAFGLPIVAMPVGGMHAELNHGENVWFSKNTQIESFGNAILELMGSQIEYASISKKLLSEFDKSSMEFAISKYFNKITERKFAHLV